MENLTTSYIYHIILQNHQDYRFFPLKQQGLIYYLLLTFSLPTPYYIQGEGKVQP